MRFLRFAVLGFGCVGFCCSTGFQGLLLAVKASMLSLQVWVWGFWRLAGQGLIGLV